jgi:hypothetical protein
MPSPSQLCTRVRELMAEYRDMPADRAAGRGPPATANDLRPRVSPAGVLKRVFAALDPFSGPLSTC